MSRYIKRPDGTFNGSIGAGRDHVPAPTSTTRPDLDPQVTAQLRDYITAHRDRVPDAEELSELRANFGPSGVVVDALTGQVLHLADPRPQFRDR